MFLTVNVMLFGCFSLLTICYLDVFHCERYVNWMFSLWTLWFVDVFAYERMIFRCFHFYGYKKDVGISVILYFINMIKLK